MENKCQLVRGFFVLRPCGRESKIVCKKCGKSVCGRCRSPHEPGICKECYIDNEDYGDSWFYTRRRERTGAINDDEQAALDPENQTGADTADWGDDADISAFDS